LTVYADSSFFVSIYLEDVHSKAAEQLVSSGTRVWFTPLHYAECTHAIAQQVFHKSMSAADAQQAYRHLEKDRAAGLWLEVEMPEDVFDVSADLARRHGPRLGVRTLDSLHVACALQLKVEQFWTFDERQAKLAKAAGLKSPRSAL
jgi:predicted nucleic acid-binding protein